MNSTIGFSIPNVRTQPAENFGSSPSPQVISAETTIVNDREPATDVKRDEALKLINTEKFIQQNNFIPVPSLQNATQTQRMFPTFSNGNENRLHPSHIPNFYESGENMTQERFVKSREQAIRKASRGNPASKRKPLFNHTTANRFGS